MVNRFETQFPHWGLAKKYWKGIPSQDARPFNAVLLRWSWRRWSTSDVRRALVTGLPVVSVASVSFKSLSQFLIGFSDTAHLLSGFLVVEGIGSHRQFFSARSQVDDYRKKPLVWHCRSARKHGV